MDDVGVLNCDLLVLLFDCLLSCHLLGCWSHLLMRDLLLLFRWTLVSVVFSCFVAVVKKAFQCFHEFGFLIFYLSFKCVAREVDVFSFLVLFARTLCLIVFRVERIFLFEVIKSGAVFVICDSRDERRLLVSKILPVETSEEWVVLDLLHSVCPKSVFSVTKKTFEDVTCLRSQVGLFWDVKGLLPMQDLLAGNTGFI
jgi:hypothetical protein